MAQPIMCDSEDGRPADVLVTRVTTGEVDAWCADCFPVWVVGVAARFLTEDQEIPDEAPPGPGGEEAVTGSAATGDGEPVPVPGDDLNGAAGGRDDGPEPDADPEPAPAEAAGQ